MAGDRHPFVGGKNPARKGPRAGRPGTRTNEPTLTLTGLCLSSFTHFFSLLTGVDYDQYQLGFLGVGGQTGFAGTKPSRLGIRTFGRLCASMMSVSWMIPFM